MRRFVRKVLSILLPLLVSGITMAIVGSYVVGVYADMELDTAVTETLHGFMIAMPGEVKRAFRIGTVIIIISIVAGFIGFRADD